MQDSASLIQTDSLTIEVFTHDLYQDMNTDKHLFDFSNYPVTHPMYSVVNKAELGKFKDETAGVAISEFVGLKPKMYSIKYGKCEKQAAKGITKAVIKKYLRHEMFRDCLFDKRTTRHDIKLIRSDKHQLYSTVIGKKVPFPL